MEWLQFVQLLLVPIFVWIIKVEKKLTKIECWMEGHKNGKAKTRVSDDRVLGGGPTRPDPDRCRGFD